MTERIAALGELVTRGESDLDLLISGVLRNTTIDFPLRCALVLYGEQVACPQPSRGAALAEVLLTQAFVLRDAEEADADLPLWAALRRFASLAPLERAAALLDFLRPHDSAPTRQVALQGLQSMLEHEELPAHPETEPLRRRVGELARKYLDADWLTSGENVALAINAFCAAVLLGVPLSEELAHLLLDLGRPRMLRRCHEMLAAAQTARRQRGASRSRVLDTVLALLVEAPSSPRTHADARSRHP